MTPRYCDVTLGAEAATTITMPNVAYSSNRLIV